MSDGDRVDDELQSALRGLSQGAAQTTAPGLADVRRRRARRQRNAVLATVASVVVVLGGATLALQPFGGDPRLQPIGPVLTASRTAESTSAAPPSSTGGASTSGASTSAASTDPASTGTSTSASGSTSTTPVDTADPILTIDLDSLATLDELTAAGLPATSADPGGSAQPTLPALCTSASWQEQYSDPGDFVAGTFALAASTLQIHLLEYDDSVAANAALVTLKDDARACPTVFEGTTIEVTAVGIAVGQEFVTFRIDAESGQDGSINQIWVTVARQDNLLVEAVVTEDTPGRDAAGNEQQTRDAAQANVDHLLAG